MARKKEKKTEIETVIVDPALQREMDDKLFEALKKELTGKYKGSVIEWLSSPKLEDKYFISSGSIALDIALGGKGFPVKKLVEIYGPPSGGKTSLCIEIIRNAQKAFPNKKQFIADAEDKLSTTMALDWGLVGDSVAVLKAVGGEDIVDEGEQMLNSGLFNIGVLDSVASIRPMKEIENATEKDLMGGNSKLVTKAVYKWSAAAIATECLLLFINQVRANFKSPMGGVITPGGYALEHIASVKLKVFTKGKQSLLKEKDGRLFGHKCYVQIEKNHLSIPVGYEIELYLEYGKRINPYMEVLKLGTETGLIGKGGGGWYEFKDDKIQGETEAGRYLEENTELYESLRAELYELGSKNPAVVAKELELDNTKENKEQIFE